MALIVLVIGWGVLSFVQPRKPQRLPAILGYRDAPRATPTPTPTP